MDERELSLAVVGLEYANADKSNRRFEVRLCGPGDPVELRPDPKNPHDPRAVAVFSSRGVQLGYLTAERCGWIGGKINAGEDFTAVFQEETTSAAWIRIRFGGGSPTLPEPRPAAVVHSDIPPDAEPPDDFNQDWGGWDA